MWPMGCETDLTHFSHPEIMLGLILCLSKLDYDIAVLMITTVNRQYLPFKYNG